MSLAEIIFDFVKRGFYHILKYLYNTQIVSIKTYNITDLLKY